MDRLLWKKRYIILLFVEAIIIFSLLLDQRVNVKNIFNENIALPGAYFPSKPMEKVFYGSNDNSNFTQIVDEVSNHKIQIKQVDLDSNVVMIYEITPAEVKLVYTEIIKEDQIQDNYLNKFTPNRDDIIIGSPLYVGTKWEDQIGGEFEIISLDQLTKTPVGSFDTLVIKYENDEFKVKEYFAKGIGLVKIVINNYGFNELGELRYK